MRLVERRRKTVLHSGGAARGGSDQTRENSLQNHAGRKVVILGVRQQLRQVLVEVRSVARIVESATLENLVEVFDGFARKSKGVGPPDVVGLARQSLPFDDESAGQRDASAVGIVGVGHGTD